MDLEYPEELHQEHKDYGKDLISGYQNRLMEYLNLIGPAEQREASADAGGQKKVHGPLQEPAVLSQTRDAFENGAVSDQV